MSSKPLDDRDWAPAGNPAPRDLLRLLEKTPSRSFPSLIEAFAAMAGVRKSSKSMSSHWMLDILALSEPRTLVLVAALYFEHIAQLYAQRGGGGRKRKPLMVEISRMYVSGSLPADLREDMAAVVRLRNQFVHDLYYDIAGWDPLESPFLGRNPPRLPATRARRAAKNVLLLKILLMSILLRLHAVFPWLIFEDVPKSHRKRPTNSLKPISRRA